MKDLYEFPNFVLFKLLQGGPKSRREKVFGC